MSEQRDLGALQGEPGHRAPGHRAARGKEPALPRPRKGTFVSEQDLSYGFSTMMSFSRSLQIKGFTVETRMLDQGIIPLPRRRRGSSAWSRTPTW